MASASEAPNRMRSSVQPKAATASPAASPARTVLPSADDFSTIKTAYNGQTLTAPAAVDVTQVRLKLLLKRGALLAAANWPVIAIQFVAATTFQVLLAVPLIGAAILVAVLLGADLAELLRGSFRDIFTTIARALISEPVALIAF